jgi:hypothetical protein
VARLLLAALATLVLAACGGGADETAAPAEAAPAPTALEPEPVPESTPGSEPETAEQEQEPEPEPEPKALPGLPGELAGYETWTKLNARPIPPRDADPHSGTKNVYASERAAGGTYPDGAIVVKEAIRPGKDFVGLVAMMRKERGAQPDHNDWVWIEWVRDGPSESFRVQARDAVCYGCHVGARATDYVFTR